MVRLGKMDSHGFINPNFDIVLSGTKQTTQPIFGSVFDHMRTKVLAEFAKFGITPDNTKITQEYRDAHPCNFNANQGQGRDDENWIQLLFLTST